MDLVHDSQTICVEGRNKERVKISSEKMLAQHG